MSQDSVVDETLKTEKGGWSIPKYESDASILDWSTTGRVRGHVNDWDQRATLFHCSARCLRNKELIIPGPNFEILRP